MHLKEGTSLQGGKYRIVRFINSGGFGCTYEAEHTAFRKRVAVKEFFMNDFCGRDEHTVTITATSADKRKLVDRLKQKFIHEAQSIFDLRHPGVIRVTDVFEENDTAYYVMDFIDGKSLKELVDQEGPLPEDRALRYIRQVADALAYVHGQGLLHLDIKPGNIMIDHADNAVLIDFGASRQYEEVGKENTSTLLPYTSGYAPPEQTAMEVALLSPATDVYALGATLYCLLTGSAPISSSRRISGDKLVPLPEATGPAVRETVENAMIFDRHERIQTVDGFLASLQVPHRGENSEGDTIVHLIPGNPNPRRWVVPVMVCLIAIVGILGWSLMPQLWHSEDEPIVPDTLAYTDTTSFIHDTMNESSVEMVQDSLKETLVMNNDANLTPSDEAEKAPLTIPLSVSTFPSGATVYLDGKEIGKSPIEDKKIARGKHTVKIVLDGYETFTKEYNSKSDIVHVYDETLVAVLTSVPVVSGTINGHEYVDLGLSVKWATMNVGAISPGDYGDYFAWGEVNPKYTGGNSVTSGKDMDNICGNSQYDAARYHWGSSWRLPTKKEFKELIKKCRWIWSRVNGHLGYTVVGPNGNSIFLPAAGQRENMTKKGEMGSYWSGSPDEKTCCADELFFWDFSRRGEVGWNYRNSGLSVRPVSE